MNQHIILPPVLHDPRHCVVKAPCWHEEGQLWTHKRMRVTVSGLQPRVDRKLKCTWLMSTEATKARQNSNSTQSRQARLTAHNPGWWSSPAQVVVMLNC